MRKPAFKFAFVALLLLSLAFVRAAPAARHTQEPETIRIGGAVEKPDAWTVERLSKEFAGDLHTVHYTLKGTKREARCVPLIALIEAAKPRLNPQIKNHELAFLVLARGKDGYTVSFSLGELLPQYGKSAVWVALDRDGKPLPEQAAPAELLVPGDVKPSRWVRALAEITLVDGTQALEKVEK